MNDIRYELLSDINDATLKWTSNDQTTLSRMAYVQDFLIAAGWTKQPVSQQVEPADDIDLWELRKVAEAATPGPWTTWPNSPTFVRKDDKNGWGAFSVFHQSKSEAAANALHAATFDPPTALRLLDRLAVALSTQQPPSEAAPAVQEQELLAGGWLPIVLCPTDGEWRLCKLPDGSEVVASFQGQDLGPMVRQWRVREFGYHNPARLTGESFGGVERIAPAYDTAVIKNLPEGVYPIYFRPNDTVHGHPALRSQGGE